jgi:hypothetical protein
MQIGVEDKSGQSELFIKLWKLVLLMRRESIELMESWRSVKIQGRSGSQASCGGQIMFCGYNPWGSSHSIIEVTGGREFTNDGR